MEIRGNERLRGTELRGWSREDVRKLGKLGIDFGETARHRRSRIAPLGAMNH
jgi:hypothetical protein